MQTFTYRIFDDFGFDQCGKEQTFLGIKLKGTLSSSLKSQTDNKFWHTLAEIHSFRIMKLMLGHKDGIKEGPITNLENLSPYKKGLTLFVEHRNECMVKRFFVLLPRSVILIRFFKVSHPILQ